jgi:hypothetical protein
MKIELKSSAATVWLDEADYKVVSETIRQKGWGTYKKLAASLGMTDSYFNSCAHKRSAKIGTKGEQVLIAVVNEANILNGQC